MLASDGPFRPFKQEQFQFLGGDAFMYLQKWQLGLSLQDAAGWFGCAGFVVEGSLWIKPEFLKPIPIPDTAEILLKSWKGWPMSGDHFFGNLW